MTIDKLKTYQLPSTPGVYTFARGKDILYIGRATSLRDRVESYFAPDLIATRGVRIVDMVTRADALSWQATDSVLEAIILEANLIKKHQPPANIRDKDDKSFSYLIVTRETYPRLLVIRGREFLETKLHDTRMRISTYYGPFTSSSLLRDALRIIRRMFPFLDARESPRYAYSFYRQLGLAPTLDPEARREYLRNIRHIKLFFEGKKNLVVRSLTRAMQRYAKKREYEKAAEMKRRIFALSHIRDVSLVKEDETDRAIAGEKRLRFEAYDVAHTSGTESVGVMTVAEGNELVKSEYRKFKISRSIGNNDIASLEEVLKRRFGHHEWAFPDVVIVDGGIAQRNIASSLLNTYSGETKVVAVVKDERHRPRGIIGDSRIVDAYRKTILLLNAEAHRFAITFHRTRLRSRTYESP